MRVLALTFAVLFLVAGGGLAVAAGVGARQAMAAREEVLVMEAKARALKVADEKAVATAEREIVELQRSAIALFILGGLAMVTLGLAVWGKKRPLTVAVVLLFVTAGLAIVLSPTMPEAVASPDPYLVDFTSVRQRAVMPVLVAIIGALTALGTFKARQT